MRPTGELSRLLTDILAVVGDHPALHARVLTSRNDLDARLRRGRASYRSRRRGGRCASCPALAEPDRARCRPCLDRQAGARVRASRASLPAAPG